VKSLLDAYDGRLTDVGPNLLRGLGDAPPPVPRCAHFNENLSYEMRGADQDVGSIVRGDAEGDGGSLDLSAREEVDAFEATLRASLRRDDLRYRGSFLRTERTMYQPAHVDYDHPLLERYLGDAAVPRVLPADARGGVPAAVAGAEGLRRGRRRGGDGGLHPVWQDADGAVGYDPRGRVQARSWGELEVSPLRRSGR
ncbi:LOW QUALITY PROTEIN: hypothetical protein ACHAWF_015297, partial [Thalassiosira exigua]